MTGQRVGQRTGQRILVVEDNPKNMKLVRDVLEYSGYDVLEATTGEDGVKLAADNPVDLVLMDLQLPGIDGLEAMRLIRNSALNRGVPVVAVTASAMTADRARALQAGFDGYVEKPISARALPQQVRDFIDAGGAS
jgi:two-component system cell cycle response regulator DivK